jgi:phytoene desaturase
MSKKAIVVGSGVAGLAASIRLACAGFKVTVFEANAFPGGKINSKKIGNYRFDMGPSVFTGPNYVKDLYDLCGKDFNEFPYQKMEHSFTYFFSDGKNFQLPANPDLLVKTIATELKEDADVVRNYLKKSDNVYKLIAPLFIESSLHKWGQLMNRNLISALVNIPKYKLNTTMHEENKRAFKNTNTIQLFNRFASYNGSNPYQAPAMLNMIAHLEMNVGAFLPKNGMIQITDSLYQLAVEKGVEFKFEEKVEQILVENKSAKGVQTSNGTYPADCVISNMDVAFTYEKLLPKEKHPHKILKQEKSSSAIVFYWGIKKAFPELDLHNIFFSEDYKAEYDAIFKFKKLYHDPTIYVNITSKYVEDDAPQGCENWFTMINAPIDNGQNWDDIVKEARAILIAKISKRLGIAIEGYIEVEEVMHPQIIEQRYSGKQGSIYGNASNNKYAAFYRHANFSKEIKGLYFVGVTVHPGGGIPLALNSAKLAVDLCSKEIN